MEMSPGYKQTEVGVIPDEWSVATVADIGTVGRGRIISHREIAKALSPLYPVYSSQTSNDGVMGYLDTFDFEGEYITWTTDGANAGTVFHRNGRFNCTNVCGTIKVNGHDARFVASVLARVAPRHVSRQLGNPKLMNDVMKRVSVPVAPHPEQRAIATTLSDVGALLGALDLALTKKRDLKQAAMQQLLTGQTRLPGFSEEWEMKRIGDFADCTAGGTPSTSVASYWGGQVRWMSSGDLNLKRVAEVDGRITEAGLANSSAKLLPARCVLIGLAGQGKTRGTVAVNLVELCTNQSIAAVLPNESYVPEYLYFSLDARYDELRELSSGGGGRGGLNLKLIKSLAIPFPLVEEQRAIATVLADMDAEIEALEVRRAKTRDLKQAMMQELLTGRTRLV